MSNGSITSIGTLVAFPGTAGRSVREALQARKGREARADKAGKAGKGDKASKSAKDAGKRSGRGKGSGNGDGNGSGRGKRKSVTAKVSSLMKTPALIMGPRLGFIISVVLLCALGLIMIYSASSVEAYASSAYGHDPTYFLKRQCIWVVVGALVCVIAAKVPYRWYSSVYVTGVLFVIVVAGLAAVLIAGNTSLGASRSITIGPIELQPAEFAKTTSILFFAALYQNVQEGRIGGMKAIAIGLSGLIVEGALILAQPDLGSTMILLVGGFAFLVLIGVDKKFILGVIGIMAILFVLMCIVQPYHAERFFSTWFADNDPQGDGYQSVQGFRALANGGIFGVGFGLSRQKYDYLPYAYNDFIFAVIGEELGLVGALFVVLLFMLFLYAGLKIAHMAPDIFGLSVSGALVSMVTFQALLNMLCILGIAPVTGKPLPFLSYGGSSLVTTMIMAGVVLGVSLNSRLDVRYEKRRDNLRVVDGGASRGGAAERGAAPAGGGVGDAVGQATETVASLFGQAAARVRGQRQDAAARDVSRGRGRGGRSLEADDGYAEDMRCERDGRSSRSGRTGRADHFAQDGELRSTRSRGYGELDRTAAGKRSKGVSYGEEERCSSRSAGGNGYLGRDGSGRGSRSERGGDSGRDEHVTSGDAPKGRLSYSDSNHRSATAQRTRKPRKPRY